MKLCEPMTRELREVIHKRQEIYKKTMVKVSISKDGKKTVQGSQYVTHMKNATPTNGEKLDCLKYVYIFTRVLASTSSGAGTRTT